MSTLKVLAMAGQGLVALPSYTCLDELKTGHLVRVMPQWNAGNATLSMLMPSRVGVAPQIKALADFIRQELPARVEMTV
jgi:DNA-binding transcriptional LysR family regulator